MRRRGFTLIEITVVVLLLALLAGVSSVAAGRAVDRGRRAGLADALRAEDFRLRALCESSGRPGELVLDLDEERLAARTLGEDAESPVTPESFRFPRGTELEEVRVHGESEAWRRRGRAGVSFTKDGGSATYALTVRHASGERVFLVFLGLTGESFPVETRREVDTLMERLSRRDPR